MITKTLIKDGKKYGGNYVATRSFKDSRVVCFGPDPIKVFDEAEEKGVKEPVVLYIPKKRMVHIY